MLKGMTKRGSIVKNWNVKAKGCTDCVPGCLAISLMTPGHSREMMSEKAGDKGLKILYQNKIDSTSAVLAYVAELLREVYLFPRNS